MSSVETGPQAATMEEPTSWTPEAVPNGAPPIEPAPAAAPNPRRANPLVAGLVRAMREAAATARDEVVTTFQVDAESRAEAIRAEGWKWVMISPSISHDHLRGFYNDAVQRGEASLMMEAITTTRSNAERRH